MASSEPNHNPSLLPSPLRAARLDFFRLPTKKRVKGPAKTERIFISKDPTVANWPVIILFTLLFLTTLYGLSHASPPRSRGARPLALGTAYTAVSGDAYALFYNPAGLHEINQDELSLDYGRHYSANEPAGSDFSGIYARPWRWRDMPIPIAMGFYGERPAPGAHAIDLTVGGGTDAPADRWTRGLIKFPVKMGAALTLRHQQGDQKSPRIGKSAIGLGLTGGLIMPINRRNQMGFSLRNLFAGDADTEGPAAHLGYFRIHNDKLWLFADLEYGSGGIWKFHPGAEWLFARGVLRPRLGWGFRDNGGIDSVSTGLGFYLSPLQIDLTYLIPVKTLNDNAGQFRASLSYRFGRPQFSEIYFDRALEQANDLDQRILSLTVKEAELKASVAEADQKRRLANEELRAIKARIETLKNEDVLGERDAVIRDLKARVRDLEGRLSEQRSQNQELRIKRSTVRTHTVVAGDTLQNLAREYYGDPNQWKKIYNANPDKIERGLPKPGSTLVIP